MHPASQPATDTPAARQRHQTTGLVLAGGAGRRVQGRDKGLIPWRGQPLVTHAVKRLRPLVGEVLISCNRHLDRYGSLADRVVADDRPGYQGPLAGLEAAQALVTTPLLLVSPCDMPHVPEKVFALLLKTLLERPGKHRDAVFLHSSGRDYYVCMALRSAALGGISACLDSGRRSVREWLATLDAEAVSVDLPGESLRNLNELSGDG